MAAEDNITAPLLREHDTGWAGLLDNTVLNIGVTGESGAGKSSLVNAIRGLQDGDEGAAPTGIVESSILKPMKYPHPTMRNVVLWDLPGVEGTEANLKTYMKDSTLQNCDLFIIVCMSKFKENYRRLAKELEKRGKKMYFVRTAVDQDVRAAERRGQTEEQTLRQIQREYEDNLKDLGPPPLFLISSHHPEQFGFQDLLNTLERDLPHHRRDAATRRSMEAVEMKYRTLKQIALGLSFLSGVIATSRASCFSLTCDFIMIAGFFTKTYNSFCLHDKGKINKLKNKKAMVTGLVMASGGKSLLLNMAIKVAIGVIGAQVAPSSGSTVAVAGMAFFSTCFVLLHGLKYQRKAAEKAAGI